MKCLISAYSLGDAFALTGIHAKPDDAVAEIGHLETVYYDVYNHWRIPVMSVKKEGQTNSLNSPFELSHADTKQRGLGVGWVGGLFSFIKRIAFF